VGIDYLRQKNEFKNSKLHQRLFGDVIDSISGGTYHDMITGNI
jgi:hypothetical protein